jgi:hypothetical protein
MYGLVVAKGFFGEFGQIRTVLAGVHGQQRHFCAQFVQGLCQIGRGNALAVFERVWKLFAEL